MKALDTLVNNIYKLGVMSNTSHKTNECVKKGVTGMSMWNEVICSGDSFICPRMCRNLLFRDRSSPWWARGAIVWSLANSFRARQSQCQPHFLPSWTGNRPKAKLKKKHWEREEQRMAGILFPPKACIPVSSAFLVSLQRNVLFQSAFVEGHSFNNYSFVLKQPQFEVSL